MFYPINSEPKHILGKCSAMKTCSQGQNIETLNSGSVIKDLENMFKKTFEISDVMTSIHHLPTSTLPPHPIPKLQILLFYLHRQTHNLVIEYNLN